MNKANIKKNIIWNIVGTTLNAFNSLFFLIIATRINGVNDAGIFTFAFSTATLFNIIGVYSGRVYQVTDQTDATDKDFIISKILTCSIMLLVSILFVVINSYNIYKSLIILLLCFLKMLEAFFETIYAIYQKKEHLYNVGISLTLKSVLNLISFYILDKLTGNLVFSIIMMIIMYTIISIIYDLPILKKTISQNINWQKDRVYLILKSGFSAFIISFLTLYLINSSKYIIDYLLLEKYQTIFGILLMPATVVLLFTQFLINPFLTTITNCIQNNDYKALKRIILKFLGVITIFGGFIILMAYFFGIPILELIYEIQLSSYKIGFIVILVGAVLYGMSSILSNILIAMRHLNVQLTIYIAVSVIITIIEYFLIKKYGVIGACYSYLIMTLIIFLLFLLITFIFIRRDGEFNGKS